MKKEIQNKNYVIVVSGAGRVGGMAIMVCVVVLLLFLYFCGGVVLYTI